MRVIVQGMKRFILQRFTLLAASSDSALLGGLFKSWLRKFGQYNNRRRRFKLCSVIHLAQRRVVQWPTVSEIQMYCHASMNCSLAAGIPAARPKATPFWQIGKYPIDYKAPCKSNGKHTR